MSIQRKFLFSISAVIALFALIVAVATVITTSSNVSTLVQEQKKNTADRLVNILTVTDSIMLERVKSSMALLVNPIKPILLPLKIRRLGS